MRFETMAVHAGHAVDAATGAIAKPITLSVSYARNSEGDYAQGYHYSSKGNPNRDTLEACVAALEGGETAVAFASGCAAIAAVLRGVLRPGDGVLAPDDVFQGTIRILRHILPKWGVAFDVADMTDAGAVHDAMRDNT